MRKCLLTVFLALLTLSFGVIFPKSSTNKTFLNTRSHLDNMVMEYSTWHTQVEKENTYKYDGSVQIVPFYQTSLNKENIGKYFGVYAKNQGVVRDFVSVVDEQFQNLADQDPDGIPSNYIIHSPVAPEFAGKIKMVPWQESYGFRFDYYQEIYNFFFKVNTGVVRVANDLNARYFEECSDSKKVSSAILDRCGQPYELMDYFTGRLYRDDEPGQLQDPLCKAKFGRKADTGFADVNLNVGYHFLKRKGHRIAAYLGTTIPTGRSANGEYLFEPIYGNGGYWTLDWGLDTEFLLWKNGADKIELIFLLDFKYLFENTEKRTISISDDNGNKINFGHYLLGGKKGQFSVFPLANVLTRNLKVEPGFQMESLLALGFTSGRFTFDIGYNLFVKEGESISLKDKWCDGVFAIANPDYVTRAYTAADAGAPQEDFGPFNPILPAHFSNDYGINGSIKSCNLDLGSVASSTAITHKIYGAFGYCFNEWRFPLMLGTGLSYEFVVGNTALENFAVWAKAGLSF